MTSLSRGTEQLTLATPKWAEILLLAAKFGWTLDRPVHWLLASHQSLSDIEAQSLCQAIARIQEVALRRPFEFYPTPVDMGKLAEVGVFCEGGGFAVENS